MHMVTYPLLCQGVEQPCYGHVPRARSLVPVGLPGVLWCVRVTGLVLELLQRLRRAAWAESRDARTWDSPGNREEQSAGGFSCLAQEG